MQASASSGIWNFVPCFLLAPAHFSIPAPERDLMGGAVVPGLILSLSFDGRNWPYTQYQLLINLEAAIGFHGHLSSMTTYMKHYPQNHHIPCSSPGIYPTVYHQPADISRHPPKSPPSQQPSLSFHTHIPNPIPIPHYLPFQHVKSHGHIRSGESLNKHREPSSEGERQR